MMKNFLEEEVLKVLDGNTESTLLQIKLSNKLGAADASNASVANLYGTSFLTIDNRLVHNMFSSSKDLPNIKNIYFTTPIFRSY